LRFDGADVATGPGAAHPERVAAAMSESAIAKIREGATAARKEGLIRIAPEGKGASAATQACRNLIRPT